MNCVRALTACVVCVLLCSDLPAQGEGAITTIAGPGSYFSGDGGPAVAASLLNPWGVAADVSGNVYIADRDNHRIRRVGADGTIVTIAGGGAGVSDGGPALEARLGFPSGVAADAQGNVYVTDLNQLLCVHSDGTVAFLRTDLRDPQDVAVDAGGNAVVAETGNNRICRIAQDGSIGLIAGTGAPGFAGDGGPATLASLNYPTGVAVGSAEDVYIADRGNNCIRRVGIDGVITTVAGGPAAVPGSRGMEGLATQIELAYPSRVQVNTDGEIFFSEGNRVRKLTTDGMLVTVAGTGDTGYSGDGGPAVQALLSNPVGVAVDVTGTFFVADERNHCVRRVGPDGIIATFAGGNHVTGDGGLATQGSLAAPRGVAVDGSGGVLIADREDHRVRRVGPDGNISTLAGTGTGSLSGDGGLAVQAGLNFPWDVAVALDGNAYIVDQGNALIRRVDPSGVITTFAGGGSTLGDGGPATQAGLNWPTRVAVDSQGNVYIADGGNARVRRVGLDGVIATIAGTGVNGYSGDGGPADQAALNGPGGIAVDGNGNVYIADMGNARIRRVDMNGVIETIAGTGGSGDAGDGGAATNAQLDCPSDVLVDGRGYVYFADPCASRIRRIDPDGSIATISGTGTQGYSGDGGPATQAEMNFAEGIALDASGYLYIADTSNRRVRKVDIRGVLAPYAGVRWAAGSTQSIRWFLDPAVAGVKLEYSSDSGAIWTTITENTPNNGGYGWAVPDDPSTYCVVRVSDAADGDPAYVNSGTFQITVITPPPPPPPGVITTIAGNGSPGFSGDGGPATQASLRDPWGIAVDAAGVLYIADWHNNRIRRIGLDGVITTVAGNGTEGYSADGGLAIDSEIYGPNGVAVGSDGSMYVTEPGRIRRIGLDGIITTFAGQLPMGFSGDGGPAVQASLTGTPGLVAVDAAGVVYIADAWNHRVRRVGTDGIIMTIAGTGEAGYSGDGGLATQAALNVPNGIGVDADGNVFVADWLNNRIRRVGPDGVITTVAGTETSGYSGDGGPATQAQLAGPKNLAIDPNGNVYIADSGNHRIRRVGADGIIRTVAGSGIDGYSGDGGPAIQASLSGPTGVAVDASGYIYIVDYGNNRIRRVVPSSDVEDPNQPVIMWAGVTGRHLSTDQYDLTGGAEVRDPQGLGTIVSVVLQGPDGTVYTQLFDNGEQCDGAAGDGWYGWCHDAPFVPSATPLPLGMYRIVATDVDGNVGVGEDAVERFLDLPSGISPSDGVVVGPVVELSWAPVADAVSYDVEVWEMSSDGGRVWRVNGLTSTSVQYNADGQGAVLEAGRQYSWAVWAWDEQRNESSRFGNRFIYVVDPDRPVVTQAEISGRHQDMDYYDVSGGATVADPQGLGTIASVVLQMPDGTPYAQLFDNGEECDGEAGDGRYGRCLGEPFVPSATPLPLGRYRIVVTDADGNVAVAEDEVERFLGVPSGISPADGAVVGPTVEFRWDPVPYAVRYAVAVRTDEGEIWRVNGLTSTSVQYNADGQGVPLENGREYNFAIWAEDGQGNESWRWENRFVFSAIPYPISGTVDFNGDGVVSFDDFFILADRFGTSIGDPRFDPVFDADHSGRVDSGDLFIFADNFGRTADAIVIPDPPGPGPGPYANAGAQFALDSPPVIAGIAPGESVEFTISAIGLVGVQEAEIVVEVTPAEAFDLDVTGDSPGASFTASSGFISLPLSEPSGLRVALWSPAPVDGDLALGRFSLRMSSSFNGSWQGIIRITRVSVGPSSTEQDVLSPDNLTVAVSYVPEVENPPAFSLPHVSQPPVLDGVLGAGEWEGALRLECSPSQIVRDGEQYGWLNVAAQESRISLNQLLQSEGESGEEARTDADIAANIWQMWDEGALYFVAEVRDNTHDVEGTGNPTDWWERDGMSLYLDLVNSREQWQSEWYTYYQAKLNIVNYAAAPQNSSPATVTWERLANYARTPTQAPSDIAGLEYSYRFAGSEFGGTADYVIEGKIPWQTLLQHYTEVPAPQVGTQMGFSWLALDPDGDDGYGGQLQAWGWADHPSTYATWVLAEATAPPLRVNQPNGGEEWEVGTDQTITWSADPVFTAVRIEYSTDGGATWNAIAASTENDGEYAWTVPMVPAPEVLIRVSDAADGEPADTSDGVFAIVREPLFMTAYPSATAPVLDGQVGPGEYGEAPPVFVEFSQPETPPGIVPNWIAVPTDAADLSYTVYSIYTATDLYVAVEVTDDVFRNDSPEGWQDDDVQLFIDGDQMSNDMALDWMQANAEGFFVGIDVGGDLEAQNREFGVDWFAVSGSGGGKRVAEFQIPLSAIDTQDGVGTTAPVPGEIIGLNITVGDDDNGGEPYETPDDSYGAWTGSYDNWLFNRESDWGRLYFSTIPYLNVEAPTAAGTSVETELVETGTGALVASLTFDQITQEGETTLERTSAPTLPPSGFQLGDLPVVYELSTTAVYSGPVEVCLSYSGMGYDDEQALRLFHFADGVWTNVTTRIDMDADLIYGTVASLSSFAVYELRPSVVDTAPPTISLNGADPLLLELGTPYAEPGVSASDLVDGNLTAQIQITEAVDVNVEGTNTLVYSVSDNAGNTASASRTVKVVTTPNSYGLIATHSLHLRQSSRVNSGFVGVVNAGQAPFLAGKVELVVGTRVQTAQDVRLSAPRVRVHQGASIGGELVYTQLVSVGKRATIAEPVQVAPSYWPLFQGFGVPAFQTGTPGSQTIEVRQKDSATLNAGAYGQVQVKQKGILTFTGGTYQLGDLEVGPKADIRFLAPTTLLIKGQLSLDQNSSFGPAPGSGISAAQILVYLEGVNSRPGSGDDDNEGDDEEDDAEGRQLRKSPRAAKIGVNANFQGNLYAPNGTIHLRQGSSSVGSFIGRDLILGVRAQVAAQSGWNTPGVIWQPQAPLSLAKLAGEQGATVLPAQTGLLANYPNPFNPVTVIRYALETGGEVELSVYDLAGQRVRQLVSNQQVAGQYEIVWDGRDELGRPVGSGVYLCRLTTQEGVFVGKMSFIK